MAEETKAGGTKSPAMEFAVAALRENPESSFRDLRAKAEASGFELYPIVFGRAKALLGLVATKPRAEPATRADAPVAEQPEATPLRGTSSRPGRRPGPALEFVLAQLQQKPDATPRELKAAGAAQGFAIGPQHVARARERLGIVAVRGRPTGRVKPTNGKPVESPATPPPRAARARADTMSIGLDSLVGSIRELQAERDRMRGALERIAEIVEKLR